MGVGFSGEQKNPLHFSTPYNRTEKVSRSRFVSCPPQNMHLKKGMTPVSVQRAYNHLSSYPMHSQIHTLHKQDDVNLTLSSGGQNDLFLIYILVLRGGSEFEQ